MAFFEPRIHKTLVIYWPTGLPDCTVDIKPQMLFAMPLVLLDISWE